jgi:hypothetical protein
MRGLNPAGYARDPSESDPDMRGLNPSGHARDAQRMTGIRTSCKNNPATGRIGCGTTYSGRMLHCVAPASWSTHPDGLCHETFGAETTCNVHLGFDGAVNELRHVDPRSLTEKIHQDDNGVWRTNIRGAGPTSRRGG